MALLSVIKCERCGKMSHESHSASDDPPDLCTDCKKLKNDEAATEHLNSLQELTVEQRISRLELELYRMASRPDPSRWDGRIG